MKLTHANDATGGRLPIGIPGRLRIGMHGRLRRNPQLDNKPQLKGRLTPEGKAPLQVLIAEETIEEAKIRAIREKTSVSGVVEELLQGG
ncbi:hypothetical protein [Bradyrhizobium sp. 145]|uniref:hypothetical protein n=1 Tax=Bradyrhizobium sp. 145 TaxID=2782621 RepID=UPI001FF77BD1|nr:hypothetical protein [Bradyrhizobium sp. 145]MCK1691919.1 hypothetical protein [Bradyrhizobium sp. 145]